MSDRPLNLFEVLQQEAVRLNGIAEERVSFDGLDADEERKKVTESLPPLFAKIHALKKPRTAVCFSGGGIRSATFNLGVIQRLAHLRLLPQFDFLSTVSGGGYIGSWLSSYVRRSLGGIQEVTDDLSARPANPLDPEPKPVEHLREYSNYLAPRLGLFSGDTWAIAGTYLRNLILNWLVLIPLLAAFLAIPRFLVAVLHNTSERMLPRFEWGTLAFLVIGMTYLALVRPAGNRIPQRRLYTNMGFLLFVVLPFFLAACGMVVIWGWTADKPHDWTWIAKVMAGASVLSAIVYMLRFWFANRHERRPDVRPGLPIWQYSLLKTILEIASAIVSGIAASALLWVVATKLFSEPRIRPMLPKVDSWQSLPAALQSGTAETYICFAVPLLLTIFFVQAALFVGLASWFNEDYDREWWARAGGWVLITALAWIAFTSITIYGPVLMYLGPRIYAAVGTITGLFTILVGKSSATAAGDTKKDDEPKSSIIANIALAIAAPFFAVCFLSLISLITSKIVLAQMAVPGISDVQAQLLSSGTYLVTTSKPVDSSDAIVNITGNAEGKRSFVTKQYPAIEVDKLRALEHLYAVDHAQRDHIAWIIAAGAFAWLISVFIGVNRFSMHAMYRNRLIRAYLGASRRSRRANQFSGFDPDDNFQLHKLRAESFWFRSFKDLKGLIAALTTGSTPLLKYVYDNLTSRTRDRLASHTGEESAIVCELLFEDLNDIIDEHDLAKLEGAPYDPQRSAANRELLDSALAAYVYPAPEGRPFHIINMALNVVSGENLAWQQRKARTFTASPLHCGNFELGYRPTRDYGGPGGISLGTAVAISGAAASPNMGYHTSPALSFLLTLFNVRLGWWLGNPGPAGALTYKLRNPVTSLTPLLAELLGRTTDTYPYIYLSDGGHFENLGLYEMVLRRCRCVVVIDAGADDSFGFDDLGNAIRKIRIDLGIPIELKEMALYPRKKVGRNPKYCAVGDIRYDAVDGNVEPGKLLYIKPTFYGTSEPRDVYNYAQTSANFPHESTADQFFSESQFESYRALGNFAVQEITSMAPTVASVCDLIKSAEQYLKGGDAQEIV